MPTASQPRRAAARAALPLPVQQPASSSIRDELTAVYGTWSKARTSLDKETIEGLPNNGLVYDSTATGVTILLGSDEATLQALDGIFGATGS